MIAGLLQRILINLLFSSLQPLCFDLVTRVFLLICLIFSRAEVECVIVIGNAHYIQKCLIKHFVLAVDGLLLLVGLKLLSELSPADRCCLLLSESSVSRSHLVFGHGYYGILS